MSRAARRLLRLDFASFDRVARSHTPLLDVVLPRLTRSANHSIIWVAGAVLLAPAGGQRGMRGVLRGLGSISMTWPRAGVRP